jgi:hypothetical protein
MWFRLFWREVGGLQGPLYQNHFDRLFKASCRALQLAIPLATGWRLNVIRQPAEVTQFLLTANLMLLVLKTWSRFDTWTRLFCEK